MITKSIIFGLLSFTFSLVSANFTHFKNIIEHNAFVIKSEIENLASISYSDPKTSECLTAGPFEITEITIASKVKLAECSDLVEDDRCHWNAYNEHLVKCELARDKFRNCVPPAEYARLKHEHLENMQREYERRIMTKMSENEFPKSMYCGDKALQRIKKFIIPNGKENIDNCINIKMKTMTPVECMENMRDDVVTKAEKVFEGYDKCLKTL